MNDWDAVEALYAHAFVDMLKCPTDEYPVLIADASFSHGVARQRHVELLFEKHNVPALYLARQAVLAAYPAMRTPPPRPPTRPPATFAVTLTAPHVLDGTLQRNCRRLRRPDDERGSRG